MLLSIVMMIKNEEKYLDKTLKALRLLMEDINSELIILDTGSTDSSIDIARKYTNKVFFAEWNNNFGEMRNISISYANGDWILIVDADEELINYERLKEFFKLGLYKKYNTATIELKSIFSENEKKYSFGAVPRLFKNYKDFRYKGAIHEQPLYREPIYNRIALFKHYGYLFINEEMKQIKDKRNKRILLKEIDNNPNNPYINYQLGKDYIISQSYEDAIFFMEKGHKLYSEFGEIPIFVTQDLANLYLSLGKFDKCEKICSNYINIDNKNIDIYFYLATSQRNLGKYKESIENYKRYNFLNDNYEISTQANNMQCTGDTISCIEEYEVNIIDNYYKLEMYDEIIEAIDKISNEAMRKLYFIIFMSLCKRKKEKEILNIYKKYCKTVVESETFKESLEILVLKIREKDRTKIYEIMANIKDNYGVLNKIRLGSKINIEECNEILISENKSYYGEIICECLKQKIDIKDILINVSNINIQNYLSYIVINRREYILNLYEILMKEPISFDLNNLRIYSSLAKALLFGGNLIGKKYEVLFLMYIMYQYEYIRKMYDKSLLDEELIRLVKDTESKFVLEYIYIDNIKERNKLEYIKKLKNLVIENPQYKKAIKIIIDKFEKQFNEGEELRNLKVNYKLIIEENINSGNFNKCKEMISEYEKIFKYDDLYDIKAIISIYMNDINEAEKLFKLAYCSNRYDQDILFNMAYIKENTGKLKEALLFYNKIIVVCQDKDEKKVLEAKERIKLIKLN